MMPEFKTVGLIGKANDPRTAPLVERLVQLLCERERHILMEADIQGFQRPADVPIRPVGELAREADLLIVIGGDGTLLATARVTAGIGTPLLGINLGRLGFLVDVSPDTAAEELGEVLDGAYVLEPRSMLEAEVVRDGVTVHTGVAVNDAVLHVLSVVRIIEFDTTIDGVDVGRLRADGLVVATPTGSTAYALSAGGPILTPQMDGMVIVPVAPHSLNHRPLVVGGDSVIEIQLSPDSRSPAQVALDGQENVDFGPGDRLRIRRREYGMTLIHPHNHQFLRMLRSKLRWGEQP
ncbi:MULTISPECIES: NAD(+) kinase [unclassified Thioalkalivibrio]|uniref:NAD(+) kinase n=1 Tax=unclassified Thioalkalivibrio TaxID=2621013 RepID=UPI00036F782A|nr:MULTISPECIES: NAD(+) kinase [unclassified Thioalkalivibrio]